MQSELVHELDAALRAQADEVEDRILFGRQFAAIRRVQTATEFFNLQFRFSTLLRCTQELIIDGQCPRLGALFRQRGTVQNVFRWSAVSTPRGFSDFDSRTKLRIYERAHICTMIITKFYTATLFQTPNSHSPDIERGRKYECAFGQGTALRCAPVRTAVLQMHDTQAVGFIPVENLETPENDVILTLSQLTYKDIDEIIVGSIYAPFWSNDLLCTFRARYILKITREMGQCEAYMHHVVHNACYGGETLLDRMLFHCYDTIIVETVVEILHFAHAICSTLHLKLIIRKICAFLVSKHNEKRNLHKDLAVHGVSDLLVGVLSGDVPSSVFEEEKRQLVESLSRAYSQRRNVPEAKAFAARRAVQRSESATASVALLQETLLSVLLEHKNGLLNALLSMASTQLSNLPAHKELDIGTVLVLDITRQCIHLAVENLIPIQCERTIQTISDVLWTAKSWMVSHHRPNCTTTLKILAFMQSLLPLQQFRIEETIYSASMISALLGLLPRHTSNSILHNAVFKVLFVVFELYAPQSKGTFRHNFLRQMMHLEDCYEIQSYKFQRFGTSSLNNNNNNDNDNDEKVSILDWIMYSHYDVRCYTPFFATLGVLVGKLASATDTAGREFHDECAQNKHWMRFENSLKSSYYRKREFIDEDRPERDQSSSSFSRPYTIPEHAQHRLEEGDCTSAQNQMRTHRPRRRTLSTEFSASEGNMVKSRGEQPDRAVIERSISESAYPKVIQNLIQATLEPQLCIFKKDVEGVLYQKTRTKWKRLNARVDVRRNKFIIAEYFAFKKAVELEIASVQEWIAFGQDATNKRIGVYGFKVETFRRGRTRSVSLPFIRRKSGSSISGRILVPTEVSNPVNNSETEWLEFFTHSELERKVWIRHIKSIVVQ